MFSKISVCHFLLLFSLMLCLTRSLCFTIFTCTLCLNFITPLMLYLYLFKLEPEFTTIWVLRRRWGFIERKFLVLTILFIFRCYSISDTDLSHQIGSLQLAGKVMRLPLVGQYCVIQANASRGLFLPCSSCDLVTSKQWARDQGGHISTLWQKYSDLGLTSLDKCHLWLVPWLFVTINIKRKNCKEKIRSGIWCK